jgi:hypothetical protein
VCVRACVCVRVCATTVPTFVNAAMVSDAVAPPSNCMFTSWWSTTSLSHSQTHRPYGPSRKASYTAARVGSAQKRPSAHTARAATGRHAHRQDDTLTVGHDADGPAKVAALRRPAVLPHSGVAALVLQWALDAPRRRACGLVLWPENLEAAKRRHFLALPAQHVRQQVDVVAALGQQG